MPVSGFPIPDEGLKYSHIISIAFIFYALKGLCRINDFDAFLVVLFFFYQFILSLISGSSLPSMAALVFAFYAYLLGLGLAYKGEGCYDAIRNATIIILIIISIKNIYFIDEFVSSRFYGAQVPTLYSGGGNIEATWLMLLTIFSRAKMVFGSFAFAVVVLYASRAGFIGFLLVYYYANLLKFNRLNFRAIFYFVLLLLFVWCAQYLLAGNVLSDRVMQLGDEADFKIGRIFLWGNALELFNNNYWGYGIGAGIEAARAMSGIDFRENNFHNIFLQVLVDAGVFGSLIYFTILLRFCGSYANSQSAKELKYFLISYLIIGFLEFTSMEMYFWFFFGVYSYKMKNYE